MTGMQRILEASLILCGAFAVFLLLALTSFHPADPSWSQTGYQGSIHNSAGAIGAWFADALLFTLGFVAYLIPFGFAALGYMMFRRPRKLIELDYLTVGLRLIGLILTLVGASALASINFDNIFQFSAGGVLGDVISSSLLPYFNLLGTTLLLLTFLCTGLTLVTGISWIWVADSIGSAVITATLWLVAFVKGFSLGRDKDSDTKQPADSEGPEVSSPWKEAEQLGYEDHDAEALPAAKQGLLGRWFGKGKKSNNAPLRDSELNIAADERGRADEPEIDLDGLFGVRTDTDQPALGTNSEPNDPPRFSRAAKQKLVDDPDADAVAMAPTKAKQTGESTEVSVAEEVASSEELTGSLMPSLELLDRPDRNKNPITEAELEQVSRAVEAVLQDFGVDAKVANVQPGPVVTRFELDLAPGIKVSKVSNLDKDIARSLSVEKVRVVEVIPGKSYVGLEIPNKFRETVRLSEVLSCEAFDSSTSPLTMVLGADISGQPVIVDLGKMPHLLVAGTTGSGKSVGVNVMILSLLYKSTPEDVRMIMIDPKMLELSVYEGIPHLLTEVVTDMKDAANALRWCVGEMERRYKLMSALGVRNLKGYNAKVAEAAKTDKPLRDPIWKPGDSMDELPPILEKLPNIVVVIDEFADMMMIVGKKVEELIARIAQKARAAGIHLILATQRPSVDVITGLIKANIPTRIAFTVQSKIDSRTILDQQGADQLLGAGDMLYLAPGSGVPMRVHGAFVDDHEVHKVVADWKKRGRPNYLEEILKGGVGEDNLLPGEQLELDDGESDELYDEAVAFVTETRRVSVSSVQRKFRIGYNRAARIVEQMEASGVVTSAGNNGQRDVLAPQAPRD
ncbi:MAG: DNA translocase FtsK 4TM domain-containing protein [Idiomarina sp.]